MARYFEKISFEQFKNDVCDDKLIYNKFKLPNRSTKNSAGYDFFSLFDFSLKPGEIMKIPTGIKVNMENNDVLFLVVRSSMGFKYNVRMCNQVGIIDADYYNNADNEGHIMVALMNMGTEAITIPQGERIAQGIFYNYLTVDDDDKVAKAVRGGGFGSTGK